MDTGSLLIILSIVILVGFFISRPFFPGFHLMDLEKSMNEKLWNLEHELSNLMNAKERLFTSLNDLDSDFGLGKIPDGEYASQRVIYKNEAAQVLRRIDEVEAQIQLSVDENSKQDIPPVILTAPDEGMDAVEELISSRRRIRNEKSAGFCPHCGKVIQKSDQFCPACGSKVVS